MDYVFTSPVPPREVFAAKVLMNSLTTILFGFPPILVLYLRFSTYYHTSWSAAVLAGLVTLVFLVTGLLLSADITLSLGHGLGERKKLWRNIFIVLVMVVSLLPITLLIPGIPAEIADVARVLPNGLAAAVSVGLVSGAPVGLAYLADLLLLLAWLGGVLVLGVRMSRQHFYDLLEVSTPGGEKFDRTNQVSRLDPRGKSIWSIVRLGGEGAVHQRRFSLRFHDHLRSLRLLPVFADLVSLHPLHNRVFRFRDSFSVDREGTALDSEIVTSQHAEVRERSVSSSWHALAILSRPRNRCRGRSIDSGRIVPALALTRRDTSTSRRTRDR